MHTSLSKKLLAGLLSLVMVLSLVAPSMGTQAASKYSLTDKKSVKSDVTFKYQLKGVSKNQYVKVTRNVSGETVKYNKKAVSKTTKINGTGKTLNLYVTYGDKVANYTGKFTVKIYNKKTNKVVKTIVEKTTVKVTPLEVTNVEVASTNGKYLVATFNKKLDALKVADITIREKETGELKGVASVELASDGKSATIALVGAEQSDDQNFFINANVDYTFTVTQKGVSATTTFVMDAVAAKVTVVDVDAAKKTISIKGYSNGTPAPIDFVVPDSIGLDYEEALGRTVTFWYDKNMTITKLTYANESVVYGAFKTVKDVPTQTAYVKDIVTGNKYYTQDASAGTIKQSLLVTKTANRTNVWSSNPYNYANAENNTTWEYAKITLNANGTIKTIVKVPAFSGNTLVSKVSGTSVIEKSGTEYSLKDYTIVKDGKTISIDEIVENDVVYFNTSLKFAEVFNNNVKGVIEAVYSTEFKIAGKTYSYAALQYAGGAGKLVDGDYMDALKAGNKEATIFFDRQGAAKWVVGEKGAAEYDYVTVLTTEAAAIDGSGFKNTLRIEGFNGTKIAKYDIDVANLKEVTDEKNDWYAIGHKKNDLNAGNKVTGFNANFVGSGVINVLGEGTTLTDVTTAITAGEVVDLTLTKDGTVVGISYYDGAAFQGTTDGNASSNVFKAGYKTLDGLQVTASTPVYVYDLSTTPKVTKVTTYGEFTGSVSANNSDVTLYSSNGRTLSYIAVNKQPGHLVDNNDGSKDVLAIVSESKFNTKNELVELSIVVGDKTITYSEFTDTAKATSSTTVATANAVTVTVSKDDKTVMSVAAAAWDKTGKIFENVNTASKIFTVEGIAYQASTIVTPTFAVINNDDPNHVFVEPISYADLPALVERYGVNIHKLAGSANGSREYVDLVLVDVNVNIATSLAAYADAKIAIQNADFGTANAAALKDDTTSHGSADFDTNWVTVSGKIETAIKAVSGLNGNITDLSGATVAFSNVKFYDNSDAEKTGSDTTATGSYYTYTVSIELNGYVKEFTAKSTLSA